MTELITADHATPAPALTATAAPTAAPDAARADAHPTATLDANWRFFFDLRGWILVPSVLSPEETAAVRAHVLSGGSPFEGPAQRLLDHPIVVEILTAILGRDHADDEAYHFRCENSFNTVRSYGWTTTHGTERAHVVLDARLGGPMSYQCRNGMISAGLVRAVWELNPVRSGLGGTQFLSGTHKAELPFPEAVRVPDNQHLESYACPAGSLFLFTESLLHASAPWRDHLHQRVSIFSAYNSLWAQWHRLNLDPAIISGMPAKRQGLFRGVYAHDFEAKSPTAGPNRAYSARNRSL